MTTLYTRQTNKAEGERRKDAAHTLLDAHRRIYIRRARRALLMRLLGGGTGTADDVAELVPPTPDLDPRYRGAVPGLLARAGIIRHVGYDRSCRPSRHASIISIWEIADRNAARAWLDAHPDLPDPDPNDAGAPCPAPPSPIPTPIANHQAMLF
jgi:hypothetical protein